MLPHGALKDVESQPTYVVTFICTFIFPSGNSVWAGTIQTFLCHRRDLLPCPLQTSQSSACRTHSGGRAVSTDKNVPSLWFLASHAHVHTGQITALVHLFFDLKGGRWCFISTYQFSKKKKAHTQYSNVRQKCGVVNAEEMDLHRLTRYSSSSRSGWDLFIALPH